MHLKSKRISLLILGVTALVFSRVMFSLFHDSEGPNLLVVIGTALIVYLLSWIMFKRVPDVFNPLQKLFITILIQVVIVTAFYFCLS